MPPPPLAPSLLLPDAPALIAATHGAAVLLTPDGELSTLRAKDAVAALRDLGPPILEIGRAHV